MIWNPISGLATLAGLVMFIYFLTPTLEIDTESETPSPRLPFSKRAYVKNAGIYSVYSLASDCVITGTRSEENGQLIREMRINKLWSHRLPKPIPELPGGARETIYCTLDELQPMRQIYEIQIEVWYSAPMLGRRCRAAEFEAIPKSSGDEYIWEHRGDHACRTESDLAIIRSPSLE